MPKTTDEILRIIAEFRKVPQDQIAHTAEFNPEVAEKIEKFISKEEKIRFVIAGFPSKSMSRTKTLGDTPDMAEVTSLTYLNQLCQQIQAVYPAGAEIVIYNDAFAFRDYFPKTFTQQKLDAYAQGIRDILKDNKLDNIIYTKLNLTTEELAKYAESEQDFEARMRKAAPEDMGDLILYRGLMRFAQPEIDAVYEGLPKSKQPSNSQKKREAKRMGMGLAIMSRAHRTALNEVETDAVRLSAHAKPVDSAQLGAHLTPDHNTQDGTPWHNALSVEFDETTGRATDRFRKVSEVLIKEKTMSASAQVLKSITKDQSEKAVTQTHPDKIVVTTPSGTPSHIVDRKVFKADIMVRQCFLSKKPFQLNVTQDSESTARQVCEEIGVKPTTSRFFADKSTFQSQVTRAPEGVDSEEHIKFKPIPVKS